MAATIITRTIGGIPDQRANLLSSQIIRQHGIAAWSTLRIGIRFSCNGAVNFGATSYFVFGLVNTAANSIFLSTNFIGFVHDVTGFVFHAAAGANAAYYARNVNLDFPYKIVAGVGTLGTALAGDLNLPADATTATRRMLFLDFAKGAPNWTLTFFRPTGVPAAALDVTAADFQNTIQQVTPSFTGHTRTAMTPIAFSEVAGTVDSVTLYWATSGAAIPIEICDIAVVKVA